MKSLEELAASYEHDYSALYDSSVRALTKTLYRPLTEAGAHIVLERRFYDLAIHMKRSDPKKAMFEALRAIAQDKCKENK